MTMFRPGRLMLTAAMLLLGSAVFVPRTAAANFADRDGCTSPTRPLSFSLGLGFLCPLPDGEPVNSAVCRSLPQDAKDSVYIFMINGLDPLFVGNLNGLCGYLHDLGYHHTEVGQLTATWSLSRKIQRLRCSDPNARIVLLGFSIGANCARSVAWQLNRKGVPIDLLIYLGGDLVVDGESSRPPNVGRILNITGHGLMLLGYDLFFNGDAIDGARNIRLAARHITLPTRRETIEVLVEELVALTECAPAPAAPEPALVSPELTPAPATWTGPGKFLTGEETSNFATIKIPRPRP